MKRTREEDKRRGQEKRTREDDKRREDIYEKTYAKLRLGDVGYMKNKWV